MLLTDAAGSEPHKAHWLPHPQRRILRLIRMALPVIHCQGPKANLARLSLAPAALRLLLVNTLAAILLGTKRVRNVLRLIGRKNSPVATAIRSTRGRMLCGSMSVMFTDAPLPIFEGHLYRQFLNILMSGQKKHVDVSPSFMVSFSRPVLHVVFVFELRPALFDMLYQISPPVENKRKFTTDVYGACGWNTCCRVSSISEVLSRSFQYEVECAISWIFSSHPWTSTCATMWLLYARRHMVVSLVSISRIDGGLPC